METSVRSLQPAHLWTNCHVVYQNHPAPRKGAAMERQIHAQQTTNTPKVIEICELYAIVTDSESVRDVPICVTMRSELHNLQRITRLENFTAIAKAKPII